MVDAGSYIIAGISFAVSFIVSLILTKLWIRIARNRGIIGRDMNKYDKRETAEAGGIAAILGIIAGLFSYIFLNTFYLESQTHLILLLAIITTLLLASFIGFVDDVLGWRVGLPQWQKPLLTIPIAVPLMVINAGQSDMFLPVIGAIELGLIYPLIVVPLGIVGAANGFNILAGLNGLEAGLGAAILGTMGFVAWQTGFPWLSLVAFSAVFALLGFLWFNKYPSKVFPGNALTYGVGALIAMLAILGNMEKIGVFLFIPFLIELAIKAKHKFKSECFGEPQEDGTLKPPEKIGSLTHIFMRFFKTEKAAAHGIIAFELILCLAVILFYI